MIEIVNEEDVEKLQKMADYIGELLDPKKLANLQVMGKHGNPLSPMDTGLGLTIEDLSKNYPDIYKMYLNSISICGMVEDVIVEVFE